MAELEALGLRKASPRDVPTGRAYAELLSALEEVRARHGLTFAEVFWVLAELTRSWASSALACERRQGGTDGTPRRE